MQDSDNNPEEFVEKVFRESQPTTATNAEERIARTISKAQRKTNARDIILLVFVRFWIVLAEITCKLFANSSKHSSLRKP